MKKILIAISLLTTGSQLCNPIESRSTQEEKKDLDIADPFFMLFKLHFPNAVEGDFFSHDSKRKTMQWLPLAELKNSNRIMVETTNVKDFQPKPSPKCSKIELGAAFVSGAAVVGVLWFVNSNLPNRNRYR